MNEILFFAEAAAAICGGIWLEQLAEKHRVFSLKPEKRHHTTPSKPSIVKQKTRQQPQPD